MGDVTVKIGAALKDGKVLLMSVGSKDYRESMKGLAAFSAGKFRKVCYVTLNDPYEAIAQKLGESAGRMFFIDCVTSTIKPPAAVKGVSFVSSPRAFTEISIAMKRALKEEKADFAIFDSVSALMVYDKSMAVLKFVHSLVLTCRESGINCVFVILKEDVDNSMIKDLNMFVDKVVEVG